LPLSLTGSQCGNLWRFFDKGGKTAGSDFASDAAHSCCAGSRRPSPGNRNQRFSLLRGECGGISRTGTLSLLTAECMTSTETT
jgi:hypothetical protein